MISQLVFPNVWDCRHHTIENLSKETGGEFEVASSLPLSQDIHACILVIVTHFCTCVRAKLFLSLSLSLSPHTCWVSWGVPWRGVEVPPLIKPLVIFSYSAVDRLAFTYCRLTLSTCFLAVVLFMACECQSKEMAWILDTSQHESNHEYHFNCVKLLATCIPVQSCCILSTAVQY